ncbi:Nuclear transcription factor Y subunit B-3 [Hibiscus syriacus]|uniref:Nuclear transcription factor Y subunit B-3 n=1 Tax=Hibiscus syriacus TaxID=106335 RepID=A0A6A3CYH5_HIBSY|nr:nuclear transcription factor Y subunit B-5-like [Hibiscus syriacus]KAE8734166.1 Nuclear transcription factor Y subunit B-3 [Hibiscus syriacus]
MSENIIGAPNDHDVGTKEQDRLLPIANVGRIMKQIVPQNAKISKEAKETMQECVSEFIGFVTSEASQKCRKERRKTVNGDDICWTLAALGFDDYEVPLKWYLRKFRELEGEKAAANQTKDKEDDERYPLKFSFTGSSSKDSNFRPLD